MLGSLEDESESPPFSSKQVKKTASFSGKDTYVFTSPTPDVTPQQQFTVMNAQRVGAAPRGMTSSQSGSRSQQKLKLSKSNSEDSASLDVSTDTEVDVTPLPSDELNTERSATDRPLTVSQLTSPLPSAKTPRSQRGANGALRELRQLENKHSSSDSTEKHKRKMKGGRTGKENARNQQQQQQQRPHTSGGQQMPWLPLLHLPSDRSTPPLRFPHIPTAWPEHAQPQPHPSTLSGLPFMPLLRASSSDDFNRYEVPQRDPGLAPMFAHHIHAPPHPGAFHPMPLLHADWSSQPRLIPPHELLQYEQRRYGGAAQQRHQLQAEVDAHLRNDWIATAQSRLRAVSGERRARQRGESAKTQHQASTTIARRTQEEEETLKKQRTRDRKYGG